ncbi:MAG: hypothetical protein H6668_12025 [Ardenticatenaceae bacterium]|nr:hypothetical protein [Ardenticatenaceae bacterium]
MVGRNGRCPPLIPSSVIRRPSSETAVKPFVFDRICVCCGKTAVFSIQ